MDLRAQALSTEVLSAVQPRGGTRRIDSRLQLRLLAISALTMTVGLVGSAPLVAEDHESDRLKELQTAYVVNASQKTMRAYHFGSQGPGNVFSNHTSHTNRLVPVYVFGKKADLGVSWA